jgi:cation transport ATPase
VFGGTLWLLHNKKQLNNRSRVITFVDRAISHVWMVFGIASFMISIISFLTYIPILFIVLLTMGMATAITGLIIRFKPIIFSGFIGILFSPLCVIVRDTSSILIFAAVFVLMMVIPGHMLNYKAKRR